MRKYLSLVLFLVLTITMIGVVGATDYDNSEEVNYLTTPVDDNSLSDNDINTQNIESSENMDSSSTITSGSGDEDCCTVIVQGENNDSSASFRRDGDYKVTIDLKHNDSIIKHSKVNESYFVHMMISKDGWVIGNGGVDGSTTCRSIESYSLNIINDNQISSYYLNKIFSLKSQSYLGHYVIKAPNGTFNLFIRRDGRTIKDSGVLKPGQYLVVPNSCIYYQKGTLSNYRDTQDSMLKYSSSLASHDKYGTYRRQIISFYYKNNIVNSTVKIIASNDNGRYVGVNSARYIDDIKTNTRLISSGSIPVIDKYIDVDEVNFFIRKTKINVTSQTKYVNGSNVVLTASVKDEFGQNVNGRFVSVLVDGKTLKYANGSVMYFNVRNGQVSVNTSLSNIWKKNNFTYYMRFYGGSRYADCLGNPATVYVNNIATLRTYHDSTVIYGGTLKINNTLVYAQNNSNIAAGKVFYKINGKTIRNSTGDTLIKEVENGVVHFEYTFDSRYKAKTYVLTTIYFKGVVRKEYNTTITIRKIPTRITSSKADVKNNVVYFTGKLVGNDNKAIVYDSYCCVKINGKTLKNANSTRIFNITNGVINLNFVLPYKLKKGNNILSIVLPELKETLSLRNNYTLWVE